MTSKTIAIGIVKATIILALIGVLLFLLFEIKTIFIYILIALILTLIGNPIQLFLKSKLKFNNMFSTIATVLVFVFLIAGFILLFLPLITNQSENLSVLNTTTLEKNLDQITNQISLYLENHNIDSKKVFRDTNITNKIDFKFIPNFMNTILTTLSNFGLGLGSVLFITFFFLKDKVLFIIGIKNILPTQYEEKILHSLDKINHLLSRYFIGLLLQLLIVFILYFIVLLIFGVDNSFVIALLCAILNIIPYVGPLIASVLAAILTMLSNLNQDFQSETLPLTIFVLIGFWVVQVIDNNISQPIIFSKSVNSHPLEIFLVILSAGFLFGITGMIIAVPLFTMLKVISKEFLPNNVIIKELTKDI